MTPGLTTQILELGLDDWVRLVEVVYLLRENEGIADPGELRVRTLEVVRDLTTRGYVKVGDLVANGMKNQFRPWDHDTPSTLAEVDRRWSMYGGPFDFKSGSDVCWLSNTREGDDLARARVHPQ
jgi:hypothetical protein